MNAVTVSPGSQWRRRLRNALVVVAALLASYALLGFVVVPLFAKTKLETLVTAQLGRRATVEKIEFNPFTLRTTLHEFALADREPGRTLFKFEMLDVDLSSASLWKWAPVFDAVRLVRPKVDLARNADGSYSIQDLIGQAAAAPDGPPPPFSINNIEIDDGAFSLDDRPHHRNVTVTNVGIGIPFLSSLPYEAQIRVTPRFDGAIDGTRFALTGSATTPFADTEEATLELNLDALPLARYVEYAALPQGVKLNDGALTTRLKLAFVTEKGTPRTLTLSGTARVDRLAVARKDDSSLVAARAVETTITKFDPLRRAIVLDRVSVEALEIDLRRFADGALEIGRLLTMPSSERDGQSLKAESSNAPWTFAVADARIQGGTVRVADETVSPAFGITLTNVAFEGKKIASSGVPGIVDVTFDSDAGAHFGAHGDVDFAGKSARGHFSLTAFRLAKLYPYYADALDLEVRRGMLDLAGDFAAAASSPQPQFTLTQGAATLTDLEAAVRGERDPLWRIPRADLDGIAFDLGKRSVSIDKAECRQGAIRVVRQSDGVVNFARLVRTTPQTGAQLQLQRTRSDADSAGWQYVVRKLLVERVAADIEDRMPQPPIKLAITNARIAADNLSNARNAKGTVDLAARIGATGRIRVAGATGTNPPSGDWRVDASALDLVPLRPYFESRTNVAVTSGAVTAKGRVSFAGSGPGGPRATYVGDVAINDFNSLDRPTSQELVRWKTLTLTGVDMTSDPTTVALGAVALDQFYARLIVNPDGTLNLQRLLAARDAGDDPPGATNAPERAQAQIGPAAAASDAKANDPAPSVSIGRVTLSGGEVQFSDFFVKPNYSAHLTEVAGSVSALSAAQAGEVELAARVESTAPVEIRGTLNPFARDLTLDLTAKANDIDLPPLTPYSSKYAGYGIQKGKLSLEVHYRIDNRKLAATNKLVLDQLTFGERVESPTATKLPVLLAVALLKDRNGVIHLDLPIEGTLDDPKFSVWGVIVQIIVNLVTKAATAPFALLGALAGGGGEQLAYVEFAPGRADVTTVAETKLRSLAKALADRPGLKLDAAGRATPDIDRGGLQRVALDRAMRVQKQKALAAQGESAPSQDALTIDAGEYPKYLAAVYRDAKLPDKPRNVLGLAKDIPPAEMEALLLASYGADDEALRTLANQRAQAVKQWFVDEGGVVPERVFIVAAKLTGEGIQDKGAPTRVDFSLR
jgi:uncharacterized protein involved in outer membrane biogenesis